MTTPRALRSTSARFTTGIASLARRLTAQAVETGILIGVIAASAVVVSIVSAPGMGGLLGACLAVLMVTIAVIDWRNFIIPNALNAVGFCLGLVHALVQQPDGMLLAATLALLRGAALALLFLTIRYGYSRIRKRQGLGLGDVKLAGVAGAWLDWTTMPLAVEIAAFAALAIYALRQLILGRPISATSRLPFGLFFAPAVWICWLIGTTFFAQI
jgi:leader peptidase (prepilin peptidase) / N-methyltransferase